MLGFIVFAGWTFISAKSRGESVSRVEQTSQQQPAEQATASSLEKAVNMSKQVPTEMRGYVLSRLPLALSHVVTAGDRVDVLATFQANMKTGKTEYVTVTLLQQVKVLGVGTVVSRPSDKGNAPVEETYVVLALSPMDSQYLALATMEGVIDVIVRSPNDAGRYAMEIASFEKLFK